MNELRVALRLLQDDHCAHLEYEARIPGTSKSIDFTFTNGRGQRLFYDVKTVLPDEGDAWALHQEALAHGWYKGTVSLDEEFAGGELAHYAFASRYKFIEHTRDLEAKIRAAGKVPGRTYFRLVLCGDNYRWHPSHLEDFADTYFNRRTPWDHLARMQAHTMQEKGWSFDGGIDGFCYFERGPSVPVETAFALDVRGPG